MSSEHAAGTLIALAGRLAFPRRTGTSGNDRAREIIAAELKARGYDAAEEVFWYKPRRLHVVNTLVIISLAITDYCIFAILWFQPGETAWLTTLLATVLLSVLFFQYSMPLKWRMNATLEGTGELPRNAKRGINIVAKLDNHAAGDRKRPRLIVGAHYDSISLAFPPGLNLFIFLGNTVGILFVGVLAIIEGIIALAGNVASPWFRLAIALLCLLSCCTLVARLANKRTNRSDGAVDNATGCAVLLELAGACKKLGAGSRFSEITFVFFDAEEEGLWGSAFHAARHERKFGRDGNGRACFVSIDEPGGSGPLVISASFGFPRITRPPKDADLQILIDDLVKRTKKGISTWMPYPASDHAPFAAIGMPSIWVSHACTIANTRHDTMSGVSGEHMDVVLQALLDFMRSANKEEQGRQAGT
ncbi:MAG: M28 family metallopeptidase [Candidatus Sigynarchaeota archaeon]